MEQIMSSNSKQLNIFSGMCYIFVLEIKLNNRAKVFYYYYLFETIFCEDCSEKLISNLTPKG